MKNLFLMLASYLAPMLESQTRQTEQIQAASKTVEEDGEDGADTDVAAVADEGAEASADAQAQSEAQSEAQAAEETAEQAEAEQAQTDQTDAEQAGAAAQSAESAAGAEEAAAAQSGSDTADTDVDVPIPDGPRTDRSGDTVFEESAVDLLAGPPSPDQTPPSPEAALRIATPEAPGPGAEGALRVARADPAPALPGDITAVRGDLQTDGAAAETPVASPVPVSPALPEAPDLGAAPDPVLPPTQDASAPDPDPAPEPTPVVTPDPDPVPEPDPVLVAQPAPVVAPDPIPDPIPDPQPADPSLDPSPVLPATPVTSVPPAPVQDPTPVAAPIPDPQPVAAPDPDPQPVVVPDPQPVVQPDPTPAPQPDPVPVVVRDPQLAPPPDPVAAPDPDPVPVVQPDPVVVPDPQPVPDPVSMDPVPVDPIPVDPIPVDNVDPSSPVTPTPVASPDPTPTPDPIPDPQPTPDPVPVAQPDPIVIPDPIPDPEPAPADPILDPRPEQDPQPVASPDPDPQPTTPEPDPDPQPTPGTPVVVEPVDQTVAPPAETPVVDAAGVGTLGVFGGRVTVLDVTGDAPFVSVTVTEQPDVGRVTVNPDGTLALVLSHPDAKAFSGALDFSYQIARPDGSVDSVSQNIVVSRSLQDDGWGEGDFYMLQTDDSGELVIEHGDNHRKVYVSGEEGALSREDIAELEGLRPFQVNAEWLANSQYGRSPETALDEQTGMMVWDALTGEDVEPGSHWLLFEKGYEYEVGRLIGGGSNGESELQPLYIGSYGSGDLPVLNGDLRIFQAESSNIVIRDIALGDKLQAIEGGNFLIDGIDNNGEEVSFLSRGPATLRDSLIVDVHDDSPHNGGPIWDPAADRISGFYSNLTQGLLLENNFFDLNGWETDYSYDLSSSAGQAPSLFNHNIYINRDAGDVTIRDNIILRGASVGAQVRPGGFIEDNVFAGNNIGVNFLGGRNSTDGALTGNFSLFTDNVVTSGGFHAVADAEGASTWGVDVQGRLSTLVDNIVAHLTDPNSTPEFHPNYYDEQRTRSILDPSGQGIFFDNTAVYNWTLPNGRFNDPDANIDGLNTSILDQTTIENFTAMLLSQAEGSVEELAGYLRAQYVGDVPDLVDAELILAFFQNGFGVDSNGDRIESATLRFVPDGLSDGIRWDNRRNWDTEDLPGAVDGDSVDLAGNWVIYGGTTTLDDLDLGSGGHLTVTHGYLAVSGLLEAGSEGGAFEIDNAGQVWINGYSDNDLLDVDVDGGRFANTGRLDGTIDLEITDNAQGLLATAGADFTLEAGSRLAVVGSEVEVGFDGANGQAASLRIERGAELEFVADSDGFAEIGEFRSGHFQNAGPNVNSRVDLGGNVTIDVSALDQSALVDVLISADQLNGRFDQLDVTGLGNNRDATVTINYDTDDVLIELTAAGQGSGQTDVLFVG